MNKLKEAIANRLVDFVNQFHRDHGMKPRNVHTEDFEWQAEEAAKAVMPFIEKALDSNLIGRTQEMFGMQTYAEFIEDWIKENIGETIG